MTEREEYLKKLDELLQPNYEWLRAQCRRVNPKYRDELFQETLVRAMKYAKNYDLNQDNIQPWLYTVMKNQSKTINAAVKKESFRRKENFVTYSNEGEEGDIFEDSVPKSLWQQSAEDIFTAELDDDLINKALDSLESEFQDVIRLNMIQGFSYAEIAEILNHGELKTSKKLSLSSNGARFG